MKIEGFAKVEWIDVSVQLFSYQLERFISYIVFKADQSNVKNSPTAVNKNGKTQNEKIKFRGHEDYMNTTTYLIGGPDALATTELAPGSYQYDFQSVLPSLLPTSFEAKHGAIRYNINVILERPWKNNLTFKSGFTVLKHLDLNYENPALKIPTKMEEQKSFYCGFCKTNPIYLAASIPMSGYVSGQSILVSIQINNQSSIDVESLKVSLIEIIFYNSQVPEKRTKNETITISEINCGKVNKKCSTTFDQTLNIPALPPSNMNYCRILNVAYEVWVVAKMSGFHSDSTIKIPITLGTIPLNLATPIPSAPPTIANLSPLPIANVINQHTSMTYTNEIRK